MDGWPFNKVGSERHSSSSRSGVGGGMFEYFGWVYHLSTNKIGHEYCHLQFLFLRGKYVEMYKRDPHENPGIRPVRRVAVGPTPMVEELGRRKAGEAQLWMEMLAQRGTFKQVLKMQLRRMYGNVCEQSMVFEYFKMLLTQMGKGVIVNSVGVIEASADTAFEVILNLDRHQRYEWDTRTSNLELIDSYDGYHDVVHGIFLGGIPRMIFSSLGDGSPDKMERTPSCNFQPSIRKSLRNLDIIIQK
ncbi:hypothetical protein FF1_039917 [Malus domestica]